MSDSRRLAFVVGSSCAALLTLLIPTQIARVAGADSARTVGRVQMEASRARLAESPSLRFDRRGNQSINLSDARDLIGAYTSGSSSTHEAVDRLGNNQVSALTLASDDFDEDGVPDLACGYATANGGILTINRGNVDSIYPYAPEARQRVAQGLFTDAPFLSPGIVIESPQSPDFLIAGDFNADDHRDLIAAKAGDSALYFFAGDGHGGFAIARQISIAGSVTALESGDINRRDGLTDFVVGITGTGASSVLVYESPLGAINAQPEEIPIPAPATSLALGDVIGDCNIDLAIGAGRELMLAEGRDRRLSVDAAGKPPVERARVASLSLGFNLKSIAIGNFRGDDHNDIALLGFDGGLRIAENPKALPAGARAIPFSRWRISPVDVESSPTSTRITRARISTSPADSIVVVDPSSHRVNIVDGASRARNGGRIAGSSNLISSLTSDDDSPVAVLPMRLNRDALSDLVLLHSSRPTPSIVVTLSSLVLTVNSAGDGPDAVPGDGICDNGSGQCTLRAALAEANANPGLDTIRFSIGSGVVTIANTSPLSVLDSVVIDGTTQPGFAGTPLIELNCTANTIGSAINLQATGSTVRGLVINNLVPVFAAISVFAGSNNIEGSFIGTNVAGNSTIPNGTGILISNGSSTVIGGSVAAAANLISGNSNFGVRLVAPASANLIKGNLIGTDAMGKVSLGNSVGVSVAINSNNNTIGGTVAGAGNVISANSVFGLNINGGGNLVQGNLIGTDSAGTVDVSNAEGVAVIGNSLPGNTIGGVTPAARNVISGNAFDGVEISSSATSNLVQGNFIGLDIGGTAALPNDLGVDINGAVNNTIGGTVLGAANLIQFNTGVGIDVVGGTGNAVLGNRIASNTGLGIDLNGDGVTANDPGDLDSGPNNLQNFPVLTSVQSAGATTQIQGTLNSTPNSTFRLEFFSNATCDPSGNGEGATFLGFANTTTNGSGNATFSLFLPVGVPLGSAVVATATDPLNNTSEFSACSTVLLLPCAITCPGNQTVSADPNQCGAVVIYPAPTTIGSCATVICTPPSGGVFSVGTTLVTCTASAGPSCSFNVTVVDDTAPRVTCNGNITANVAPGGSTVTIDYVPASLSDNCPGATIICLPPSGFAAPVGITTVTCTGKDSANNAASCSFTVTVIDPLNSGIRCPADLLVDVGAGQTSGIVNYPPPVVGSDLPEATVVCVPPSGSTFPLGVTAVTCTATDSSEKQATCGFTVTLTGGPPSGKIVIPGGKSEIAFGENTPVAVTRKPPKSAKVPCGLFAVENSSFAPLSIVLDSINRIGADVDEGRISDPKEGGIYELSEVLSDGGLNPIAIGSTIKIAVGQAKNFCLKFGPSIPGLAGTTTGLHAPQAIPDAVKSLVKFRIVGGGELSANVSGKVETALQLINPNNPKKKAKVSFTTSGDLFTATFSVFDSNLDVNKATYELLDGGGRAVAGPFDVDLTQAIRERNLVRGQSFSVEQSFSSARSHPEIKGVRIAVSDSEVRSVSGTSLSTPQSPVEKLQFSYSPRIVTPSLSIDDDNRTSAPARFRSRALH